MTLAVTPNGSATSVASFSALTAAQQAQMNGGQVEVKAVGSVSLLAGLNTGSSLLSLYHIAVQGDAIQLPPGNTIDTGVNIITKDNVEQFVKDLEAMKAGS